MTEPESQYRAKRTRIVPAKSFAMWDRRELLLIILPVAFLLGLVVWYLLKLVHPAPPRIITIATGGTSGAYHRFGRQYAEILQRSGVTVRVKATGGSLDNIQLLSDPNSGVDLALLQGGVVRPEHAQRFVSLGRAFVEPLWVFYRADGTLDMLHQLKGRRVGIGPAGSGTRHLALALLSHNEIGTGDASFSPLTGKEAADALRGGALDAVFLAMAPESPVVQSLVRDPSIKLMSFSQAEAYTRQMPYLKRVSD